MRLIIRFLAQKELTQILDLLAVRSVQSGQNVRKMELEFGRRLHVQAMRTV